MLLAQSLDLIQIGTSIASIGTPALLGIGLYIVDSRREKERSAHEAEKAAIRSEADRKLQAAQDKLDAFQNAQIAQQAALLAQLTGGAK
jgi:hypothetical protein